MTRFKALVVQKIVLVSILIGFCGCAGVSGSGGPGGSNNGPSQAIIAFGVQPGNIIQGQAATLSWQVTNAASFSISPAVGTSPLPMTGTASVSPTQTTTYTATATDSKGRSTTATTIVNVVAAGSVPAITLSFQPAVVGAGQSAVLNWTSTNALSVAITPSVLTEDQTSLALSGSVNVVPTATTTYTATATGVGGVTTSTTATINLLGVTLTATPAKVGPGQSATLNWTSTNATALSIDQGVGVVNGPSGNVTVSPSATTTYTITATNGTAIATATATVTAPLAVTLTANPVNIAPGGQSKLAWTSTGAATVSIDQGVPPITGATGTVNVSPAQNTTYTITATDAQGNTATSAATVNVGTNSGLQGIKHIIVMLQENRSFDNYFSKLGEYAAAHGIANYQINVGYDPNIMVPLIDNSLAHPFHQVTERTENLSPAWDESHFDMDQQKDGTFKMDQFAKTTHSVTFAHDKNGLRALGYYDDTDLPYYYALATQFATSDSFHSSVLANTQPNREYMFCATTQGRIFPSPGGHDPWTCPTIFSSLQNAGVNWKYYNKDGIVLANFADYSNPAINARATHPIQEYFDTLASATADQDLPSFVWIDSGSGGSGLDEHPDNNVQHGAAYVKTIIDALMKSPAWSSSIFILAYDEGGGLYDHVPPFTVVAPDDTPPQLGPTDLPGDFTLSGFRVPIVVISPYVKPNFVSHTNRELTSILKLIETRFSLPALTRRDAAADDMTEFFDFVNPPALLTPPTLPAQPTNGVDDPTQEAPPQ